MRYGPGIALGAWLVANVLGYRLVVWAGWPLGSDAPSNLRGDVFNVAPFSVTLSGLALLFLVPIVLVLLWTHLERATGIDQELVASALRWTARALTTRSSVAVITLVLASLFLPVLRQTLWWLAVPALVFLILLPFGVFDIRVASAVNGAEWWRLRWPGAAAFRSVLIVLAVMVTLELVATMILNRVPPLVPLLFVADAVAGILAVVLVGSILLFRAAPTELPGRLREWLSWQRLGAIVALNVRIVFLLTFLAAPVFVAAVLLWKVVPFHATWAASQGTVLPPSARMLVFVARAVETSGVIATSFVAGLALSLAVARILWVTSRTSARAAGA